MSDLPDAMILYGVSSIAAVLGIRDRQAQHLVDCDRIPTWREGRVICAKRSTIQALVEERDRAARARCKSAAAQ